MPFHTHTIHRKDATRAIILNLPVGLEESSATRGVVAGVVVVVVGESRMWLSSFCEGRWRKVGLGVGGKGIDSRYHLPFCQV